MDITIVIIGYVVLFVLGFVLGNIHGGITAGLAVLRSIRDDANSGFLILGQDRYTCRKMYNVPEA